MNSLKSFQLNFIRPNDFINISSLSGGEKQKIEIIRELSRNYDILIADEPTSSMDYESKLAFINYLTEIKKDKIIILVSHDDSLINTCDYLLELPKAET